MAEEKKEQYDSREHIWEILKNGTPKNQTILAVKGDAKQLAEAKKLLESQERLRGIEVAKW